ncbi:GNAT family N-acetyltransferase [Phytomonospora endophytica]|uniref:GNAT superfamily N-acetyltransferase n=1 Tax=Phytomonospora endophytica TaxID=714109 RepID=A0A841FJD2_9ACTN|nr:GNAT family N-acetyltransferase [Phytomonospora endophytica]MBB6035984.1 GNAT superfamily N-acetyltransferase [Phytomonospora endophytica]GIG66890.1 N-acetyltransferase [Phytomonospora endophytica]
MITALTPATAREHAHELGDLLAATVNDGASVGFLAPLTTADATAWWHATMPRLGPGHHAWIARDGERVVGTVQLIRAAMPNSRHRADIAKLMVHPDARGRGLARALLKTAEQAAAELGVTLLVLDTEVGSPAERLYTVEGWKRVGEIPGYALDVHGKPQATMVFCKSLPGATIAR